MVTSYKIYKITNTINNKVYIGYTRQTLEKRFHKHIIDSKYKANKMNRAINKHGKENFQIELLFECASKVEALQKEIETIALFDSYKNGYNSTIGGEVQPSKGKEKWNENSLAKFKESRKKWYATEEGQLCKNKASERFKQLKPNRFITKEDMIRAGRTHKKWLMETEKGKEKRNWSAENMKKIQRLQHTGIYELQDPQGNIHIIKSQEEGIGNFCKRMGLSHASFLFSIKRAKTKKPNIRGKNKGWLIIRWNVTSD